MAEFPKLKPCKCGKFFPWAYSSDVFGFHLSNTIACISCGRQVKRRTFEKAVAAWNRRAGDGNDA